LPKLAAQRHTDQRDVNGAVNKHGARRHGMVLYALLGVCIVALVGGTIVRCVSMPAALRRAWFAWLRGMEPAREKDDREALWAGMRVAGPGGGGGGGGVSGVFVDNSDGIRRRGEEIAASQPWCVYVYVCMRVFLTWASARVRDVASW
jgi:hypothetical protein